MIVRRKIRKSFKNLNHSVVVLSKNLLDEFLLTNRQLSDNLKTLCIKEVDEYRLICLNTSVLRNNLGYDVLCYSTVSQFILFCENLTDTEKSIFDFLKFVKDHPMSTLSLYYEYNSLIILAQQYKELTKIRTSIIEVEKLSK